MRFLLVFLVGLGFGPVVHAADKKLATVEINVDETLAKEVVGIRTLFVIVYDNDSTMPMPYGAMKVNLKSDAKGTVFKGDLTNKNIQPMNPKATFPANSIRVKARLDKDGMGGADQPGDLSAKADKVDVGASIKLTIKGS